MKPERAKHSPIRLLLGFLRWFRSPFPVWVEALAAAAIAGLTFFIYQVTDEQRKIAKTSNVILGLQTAISEQQALIMKEQSKIMGATKLSQESADRAYIYFGRSIFSRDTGDGKIVVGVDVPIINSGNTPARQLKTLVDCAVHNGALTSDPFDLPRSQKNILESIRESPLGGVIKPASPFSAPTKTAARSKPPSHAKTRRGGVLRACVPSPPPPAHQAQPGEGREEQRQRGGEGDR